MTEDRGLRTDILTWDNLCDAWVRRHGRPLQPLLFMLEEAG